MDLKIFLKPTLGKIVVSITLFFALIKLDLLLGFGGGVGFPLKFFALDFPFLSAGFFKAHFLIADVLFFYVLASIFFYSNTGKIIAGILLLVAVFIVDDPLRGIYFFEKEQRPKLKQECEARGRQWVDGTGDTIGTCQ